MTKYLGFQYSVNTAVTRTDVTLYWRNQCETVQLLTLTPDFIAPALWPAKSPDLKPLDYRIWSNLQECIPQPVRDVDTLKSQLIKSGNISNNCSSMKRSGSGVYVFELAFDHMEDILNTNF